jgi:mono/diheme cytochrome c family protein
MKHHVPLSLTCLFAVGLWSAVDGNTTVSASQEALHPSSPQFYTKRIQPILEENCYSCHQEGASGGLRLDSREAILKGGKHGPAVVPGDPDHSVLIDAIQQAGKLKMPVGGKLEPSQVADLIAWVKAGAVIEAPATAAAPVESPKNSASAPEMPRAMEAALHTAASFNDDFFENKIRPIFANNCYKCHTENQSGGLRVDSREALMKGGDTGAAIVASDPDKSLLIQAVRQTGALKMPMGGKLRDQEVQDLVEWVKRGALWPQSTAPAATLVTAKTGTVTAKQRAFWSFQPLKPEVVPEIKDANEAHWAKTPIDHFLLEKLHANGLTPAAPADKRTLIRRATYDLTGLPPTPEEVEVFEKDKSPKAFEKVVDRLLASPRYGERWGRHWLDVARYAEDDVRGLDPKRRGHMPFDGAYRYRDWVIKALNQDIPYDQFIRMQLAGDKLHATSSSAREDNLVATSYLGAGPWVWDQAEPIQGRADERNERVDAVSRGLLGLTVACARCHNHKYDPVSQKDYYALIGIFANSTYKEYPAVPGPDVAVYESKQTKLEKLQDEFDDFSKTESKQMAEILAHQTSAYLVASWNVLGKPKKTVEEAAAQAHLDPQVVGRWVEYLPKTHKHPYLKDWQAMIAAGGMEDQAKVLAESFQDLVLRVRLDEKDVEEQNDIIRAKNDVPKRKRRDARPNEFETDDQFCPGCSLELKTIPTDEANLYLELFVTQSGEGDTKFKPGVMVFTGWDLRRRLNPEWQEFLADREKQIATLQKDLAPDSFPYVHGMDDKPQIVDVKLNVRGNPHSLGETVPRSFLTVLSSSDPKPYTQGSGRLELADDIVNSPLAMRVIVNRVWKWHFGSGIVNTPDNFGVMGDKPSNPELLDYLAYEFVQSGRSLKKLNRAIMLSAAYQTSVEESPAAHEKDGANRLYSHFNRQRLDAEELRDSVLFAAGDLDLKAISGPSADFTPENTERTVFCKVSRYRLNDYLQVFDFPNPSFTAEQRFSSNVPLQRLYFMNNPFVYKQAGALAERVHNEPTERDRITKAYEFVYERKPTEDEIALGLKFLTTTPEKPGYTVNGKPVTAWLEYARILLSSSEFQFVD